MKQHTERKKEVSERVASVPMNQTEVDLSHLWPSSITTAPAASERLRCKTVKVRVKKSHVKKSYGQGITGLQAPGRLKRMCPITLWSFRESPHAHAQPYDTSEAESALLPEPAHQRPALAPEDKGSHVS